ncbi:twin-arginine translocation signal domain-containing protein [Patescibacteria group bacterium]
MTEEGNEHIPVESIKKVPKRVSRRDFLKLSGAGLLALMTGCKVSDQPQTEPIVPPQDADKLPPAPTAEADKDLDMSLMDAEKPEATPEQVDYLKEHRQEPIEMIIQKLEGNTRLVGIGEMHNELDMEQMANRVIDQASERGLIDFLALEIDTFRQTDIDEYLSTGEVNPGVQEVFNQHNTGYRQILDTARSRNLTVVCVDNHNVQKRDDYMSRAILTRLEERPNQKGLFYAGNGHIIERYDVLDEELGEAYYSVLQINEQSGFIDTVYDAFHQSGITEPVALDDISNTPFSESTYGHPYELWSEYGRITDALVLLPKQGE